MSKRVVRSFEPTTRGRGRNHVAIREARRGFHETPAFGQFAFWGNGLLDFPFWLLAALKMQVHNSSCLGAQTLALALVTLSVACGGPSTDEVDRLRNAAEAGDIAMVRRLLEADPRLASAFDSGGLAPLHNAASSHHPEVVDLLLASGADVHAVPRSILPSGFTALHYAASHGDKATAQLLLARGAEVNAAAAYRRTPLHEAAENGDRETVALL